MIEVFKTNVVRKADAERIIHLFSQELPGCQCNFDLDDCDKIFRLESPDELSEKVITFFTQHNFTCEILL